MNALLDDDGGLGRSLKQVESVKDSVVIPSNEEDHYMVDVW